MQQPQRFDHAGRTLLVHRSGRGSGPQFVLVHGIGVAARYYRRLAAVLARSGGVHVLELPGHGTAPKPADPMSIGDFADSAWAYLDAAGLADPILVGHSMGAQIVTEMTLQRPSVSRVVLIGAVVDPRHRGLLTEGTLLALDTLREPLPTNWAVFSDYLRTGPRWYRQTAPAMMTYSMSTSLPLLQARTLIVRGARDPISSHRWAMEMLDLVPDSEFMEVPGSSHVAMHTAPEPIGARIVDFARTVPLDSRGSGRTAS
jgi:pimeloyl-ACP methyl ester carboxylesterase